VQSAGSIQTLIVNQRIEDGVECMIECALWLGHQELAFRGHRDDHFPRLQTSAESLSDLLNEPYGNFNALLIMRVRAGDVKLRDHLELSPCNEMYTSHEAQNDFINIAGRQIQQQILDEARNSPYFAVLADSTIDLGSVDQMSIALRYSNRTDGSILEQLVDFVNVSASTTGKKTTYLYFE
jgi:Domain of unknown function (DUF4371)